MTYRYKAAVFDLDGTILDTLEDLFRATNHALAEEKLPLRTKEEVRRFVGNGIGKLIERACPAEVTAARRERVHAAFTRYYSEHCADTTAPYEGIPELLARLREEGIRTGVVSNKADYAVQSLIGEYFPGLFSSVTGEREGIARKPAPDLLFETLRKLDVTAEEAVYIGDSEVDLEAAANAGMDCIACSWGFKGENFLREHGAKVIVETPEEILRKM